MLLLLQTSPPNQSTTENVRLSSSPKKTCRITITELLLSSSIYLASLSLYTKLVYKVLFKKHLIFVANISPMFFLSIHSLKTSLYLLYNSWQSYCLGYYKIVKLPGASPQRPHKSPSAFYMSTACGKAFGFSFSAPSLPNTLCRPQY